MKRSKNSLELNSKTTFRLILFFLLLNLCSCVPKHESEHERDLWWIQHLVDLSPDGYTPKDSFPPWELGLNENQRRVLSNPDAALMMRLQEVYPQKRNDFHYNRVTSWKRVTTKNDLERFISPLAKAITSQEEHIYPDDCLTNIGIRVWSNGEAVDLYVCLDEYGVHVYDKREHRYCTLPKEGRKSLHYLFEQIEWDGKRTTDQSKKW
jgi:hypothetical protein